MNASYVSLRIKAVTIDRRTHEPSVVLQESDGVRLVSIDVGPAEAGAIIVALEQPDVHEPTAQDAIVELFQVHGFVPEHASIFVDTRRRAYATLHYRSGKKPFAMSLRPSDAIALAVHFGIDLYMPAEDIDRCSHIGLPTEFDGFSQEVLLLNPERSVG